MVFNFDEYLLEQQVNDILNGVINEKFNINEFIGKMDKNNVKKISDKLLDMLNASKNLFKKRNIMKVLFVVYLVSIGYKASYNKISNDKKVNDFIASEMKTVKPNVSLDNLYNSFGDFNKEFLTDGYINTDILTDPLKLTTSDKGKDFIKNHEKLKLKAYVLGNDSINDGMLTVGYGHAKPLSKTKLKEGDRISKKQALQLFEQDIKNAENGVKRLFKMWKDNGIDVPVSQNMFDSMVSMAFNMGVNGFRGSDVVQSIKVGDYISAADSILTSRVSDEFPGLYKRREQEKELFLTGLVS